LPDSSEPYDVRVERLTAQYWMDTSSPYGLDHDDLQILLRTVGEMEPIIDAINALNGASIEQRAADIGCDPEDFRTWDDDEIIAGVVEL